jgi:Zn-dependent protease with chaperone function
MKKYNLTESSDEISQEPTAVWKSEIDPRWTILVLWPEDELYGNVAKIFDRLGTAFADLNSKTVFIDGVQVENQNLTQDHLLAIEAHEISHSVLNHHGSNRLAQYDERQEREADWLAIRILDQLGFGKASAILEERYKNYYDESSSELENTDALERSLEEYVK